MKKVIIAEQLTKKFGDFTAVDGIDFVVEPGQTFGVLGPNGAGKSSTMKMVSTNIKTRSSPVIASTKPGHVLASNRFPPLRLSAKVPSFATT